MGLTGQKRAARQALNEEAIDLAEEEASEASAAGPSAASAGVAQVVATHSAAAAVSRSSDGVTTSVPPALQRGEHGGDGGCTAAALVALGVWSTLGAAFAALDAQIAPLPKSLQSR